MNCLCEKQKREEREERREREKREERERERESVCVCVYLNAVIVVDMVGASDGRVGDGRKGEQVLALLGVRVLVLAHDGYVRRVRVGVGIGVLTLVLLMVRVLLLHVSARWRPLGLGVLGECGGRECGKIEYEQQDGKKMHD